jgi:ABC-type xylose transport system permease subunit
VGIGFIAVGGVIGCIVAIAGVANRSWISGIWQWNVIQGLSWGGGVGTVIGLIAGIIWAALRRKSPMDE